MSLTFGSLFAGIGGFDLGFQRAGMVCKWQVEIDPHCQQVLARHWPDVPRYGDVKDVGRKQLEPVDVICGGFPCQDVSVAGRREGLAGERSGLWFEFLRVITELEPEWVVVENVPGLLSSNGGRDMATIVGGLAECGYWWAYRVLDLQFFGVPQRRRRVFIVASLTRGRPQQVLFERQSSPWDTAPGREAGQELARDVAASLRSGSDGPRGWIGDNEQGLTVGTFQNTGHGWWNQSEIAQSIRTPEGSGSMEANVVAFGGNNTAGSIDVAAARNAHGSNRYDFESETFVCAFTERTRADGRNLELQKDLAYALDNPGSGGRTQTRQIVGNFGVRRLTPIECERLQGFPDDWTKWSVSLFLKYMCDDETLVRQSDSARYRQLGNAVGVPHSEWIGERIMRIATQ